MVSALSPSVPSWERLIVVYSYFTHVIFKKPTVFSAMDVVPFYHFPLLHTKWLRLFCFTYFKLWLKLFPLLMFRQPFIYNNFT